VYPPGRLPLSTEGGVRREAVVEGLLAASVAGFSGNLVPGVAGVDGHRREALVGEPPDEVTGGQPAADRRLPMHLPEKLARYGLARHLRPARFSV
jgi:hypothetical protein